MTFDMQKMSFWYTIFSSQIFLPWEGDTSSHTLPPARSLRSLALPPPPPVKKKSWLRHWASASVLSKTEDGRIFSSHVLFW